MLTILAAFAGFLGSAFPKCMELLQDRQDKKHELTLLDKQIELQKLNINQRLEEIKVESYSKEMEALYVNTTKVTGVTWVDALAATVRPMLAYAFIIMFIATKIPLIMMLPENFYNIELLKEIWTESDACIFSSIIAFYFGSRQFTKMRTGH
jgi:hypothetical protein